MKPEFVTVLQQMEPIEERIYFDHNCMNKGISYLHPFETVERSEDDRLARSLTSDGRTLMEFVLRQLAGSEGI